MKNLLALLLTFVLLVGGISIFLSRNDSPEPLTTNDINTSIASPLTRNTKLIVGDPSAPATVVEYFDYKCPSCNNFHRTTGKEVQTSYIDTGKANFEVRIIPIIAEDSRRAGLGAYCANEQDKFPDYHAAVLDYMWDTYYKSGDLSKEFEDILSTKQLSEIVSSTDINTKTLSECIDSDRYNGEINENLELARRDEVRGTPGFAIGDQSFVGGQPFSVFKTLLDIELRK